MRIRKWLGQASGAGLIAMSTSAFAITAALAAGPVGGAPMQLAENDAHGDQHDEQRPHGKDQPQHQQPQHQQKPQQPPKPQQPQHQQPQHQQPKPQQPQHQQPQHQQPQHQQPQHQQPQHQQPQHQQPQHQQPKPQQPQHQQPQHQQPQHQPSQQHNQNNGHPQRYNWNDYHPGQRPPHYQDYRRNFDPHPYQRNYNAARRYHWQPYHAPRGWYYRRWVYGQYLPFLFFQEQSYWIENYWDFGLIDPPYGFVWVRSGDDALLVDVQSGFILQAAYGLFY